MSDDVEILSNRPRRLIRIPLIPFAIAMMCGILTRRYLQLPMGAWVVLGAASLILAIVTLRWNHLRLLTGILVGVCVFALGAGRFYISYNSVLSDSIVNCTPADRNMLTTVRGQIESYPQLVTPEVEYGYKGKQKMLFLLRTAN